MLLSNGIKYLISYLGLMPSHLLNVIVVARRLFMIKNIKTKEIKLLPINERQSYWENIEKKSLNVNTPDHDIDWVKLRYDFYSTIGPIGLNEIDRKRLKALYNKYRGKRIFVIGNGPSLNKTQLNLLANEYTFGVNRIYLLYDKITWKPTFYTIIDRRVIADIAKEVNGLTGSTFFFDEKFRGLLREGEDVYYFGSTLKGTSIEDQYFSYNALKGVRHSNTVVGYAIQIAYYMGFDPIYLIGCDLGYKVNNSVKQEGDDKFNIGVKFNLESTKDDDPNHFDPTYFGKKQALARSK